jgi:hypothetical protein
MKRITCATLFFITAGLVYGQWYGYESTTGSEFDGGIGMSWIDNQAYYSISLQPDIGIGKIGIGLNVSLLYNANTGKFYSQDWKNRETGKTDYSRIIRYLRYGRKGDRFYTRIGALDAERLGHGSILNYYNNQMIYEERKVGMTLDIDFGVFGFESITNNLGRAEVFGVRGYFRPLYSSQTPVLKNFAVGASYAADLDPDSRKSTKNDDAAVYGVDVELPLIKSSLFTTMIYADYAKIRAHNPLSGSTEPIGGSGITYGWRTDIGALTGWLGLSVTIERRQLGKEYIASYFGPFYEMLRQTTIGSVIDFYESIGGSTAAIPDYLKPIIENIPVSQAMLLPMMNEKRNAWYGGLDFSFFKLFHVLGTYQKVDQTGNSGMLHFGAGLTQNIPYIAAEATYDKRGIGTFKDIRTLDYRSLARVGLGYKIKPYLLLYMDYIWTFVWDEGLGEYKPQERVQPRLALRLPLDTGR